MATFRTRTKKNGSVVHIAQIRIARGGKVVFSEASSFEGRTAAKDAKLWAINREAEVKRSLSLGRSFDSFSIAQGMIKYLEEFKDSPKEIGKTKRSTMKLMSREPLLQTVDIKEHSSAQFIEYFNKRYKEDDAAPQTVLQDAAYIRVLLQHARAAWSIDVDLNIISDAMIVSKKQGKIGKSVERARRVTLEELEMLLSYQDRIKTRSGRPISTPMKTPLRDAILFAIFSTRRLSEITRIEWDDVNFKEGTVNIRDLKNPRQTKGNNVLLYLPHRAIEIIKRQPRKGDDPRVFPYGNETIGTAFRSAYNYFGIEGLMFHDLRHEGISHLFELHYSIPQVALVSGHRSWNNLSRYTHLSQFVKFDKYADYEPVKSLGEAGLVKPV
jgi:integrase